MLTGSLAAGFRGAGRATMDVDAVIDPSEPQLDEFLQLIEAFGFYVSLDAAREALESRTMFNIVDPESGWKVDFIIRKHRPFSEAEFARREMAELFGTSLAVATLEDVVVSKLEWAKLGGSARQLSDVRALLRVMATSLIVHTWNDGSTCSTYGATGSC